MNYVQAATSNFNGVITKNSLVNIFSRGSSKFHIHLEFHIEAKNKTLVLSTFLGSKTPDLKFTNKLFYEITV